MVISWVAGLSTKKYSTVDRLWSTIPCLYAWIFVQDSPYLLPKAMASLITIWGTRLTYNFYRKGGFNLMEEDYRWVIVKAKSDSISRFLWEPFHLLFIVIYQLILLWLLPLPLYFAKDNEPSTLQYASLIMMAIFLLIETVADEQ